MQRTHVPRSGGDLASTDVEAASAQRPRLAGATDGHAEHEPGAARENEHVAGVAAGRSQPLPDAAP